MMVRAFPALILGALLACAPAAARQAAAPDATAPAAAPALAVPVIPAVPVAAAPRAQPRPLTQPVQPMASTSAGSLLQTIFGLTVVMGMLALLTLANLLG